MDWARLKKKRGGWMEWAIDKEEIKEGRDGLGQIKEKERGMDWAIDKEEIKKQRDGLGQIKEKERGVDGLGYR